MGEPSGTGEDGMQRDCGPMTGSLDLEVIGLRAENERLWAVLRATSKELGLLWPAGADERCRLEEAFERSGAMALLQEPTDFAGSSPAGIPSEGEA